MAKVELKQPIVDEIANSIKDAQAVVLVNYSGLTVEQDTILRKELREAGVQYKVYKNTMMRRAFEGTAFESLSEHLHGTNAIAISEGKFFPVAAVQLGAQCVSPLRRFNILIWLFKKIMKSAR